VKVYFQGSKRKERINQKNTTITQLKWKVNGKSKIEHLKHTRMVQDEPNEDESK